MRLDEWQKYINSEFVKDAVAATATRPSEQPPLLPASSEATEAATVVRSAETDPPVHAFAAGAPEGAGVGVDAGADAGVEPAAPVARASEAAGPTAAPTPSHAATAPRDPTAQKTSAGRRAPSPGAAYTPPRSGRQDREPYGTVDPGHATELQIAPFADYIAVRREMPPTTLDLEYASEPAATGAPEGNAGRSDDVSTPDSVMTVARASGPSSASLLENLERLRLASLQGRYASDPALRAQREALLGRLADPILSAEEAALLLGISHADLLGLAERGELPACESIPSSPHADDEVKRDDARPAFRLSSVASAAATPAEGRP